MIGYNLGAIFINKSFHSEMLKEMMEGSQIQGVIFESEEVGWAGTVGRAEAWNGPVGYVFHLARRRACREGF